MGVPLENKKYIPGVFLQPLLHQEHPLLTNEETEIQSIYVMCISTFAFIGFVCCAYLTKFPIINKYWPPENLPTDKATLQKLENKRTAYACGGYLSLVAAAVSLYVAGSNYFSKNRYTEASTIVTSILSATAFVVVSTFFWAKNNTVLRNYRA